MIRLEGLLLAVLCIAPLSLIVTAADMECHADGTCEDDVVTATGTTESHEDEAAKCVLYMAESSIPGAGWGMYTGKDVADGMSVDTRDLVIQYADLELQAELQEELFGIKLPEILISDYFWSSVETDAYFDANAIESISPGYGMLANCHLGLVNLDQAGCRDRSSGPRSDASAGASSSYQDCEFVATQPIPAGHELFDDYGYHWFTTRSHVFGDDLPLPDDYKKADAIVKLWQHEVDGKDPDLASDLWETVVKGVGPLMSSRSRRALPKSARDASKVNFDKEGEPGENTVAYQAFPNIIRSKAWLDENGMCLDHIEVGPVSIRGNQERGAFARRFIAAGAVVAPAPLVHLSRRHTDMLYVDKNGSPNKILWQGHQLLLNYCYGHPSSSVLLFPYSPVVNLINHYDKSKDQKPNVAVRWSKKMKHAEWLEFNATELIEENDHTGLMMEFYALSDISKGDEILLDYGDAWQQAWDKHIETWDRNQQDADAAVVHSDDYISAWDYAKQCDQDIEQDRIYDCLYNTPSWIAVRCWIEKLKDLKSADDDDEWLNWQPPVYWDHGTGSSKHGTLDETFGCQVLHVEAGADTYRVRVQKNDRAKFEDGFKVKNVPRSAIAFVDRPYTNNQFLRQAFRHEIQLPDEMMPPAWRDLDPEPDSSCGLYMAESSIPNSGLGMFTSRSFSQGERIFYGELAVQAEDMDMNTQLRHWADKDFNYTEKEWLLANYYWHSVTSMGSYEAADVQSVIPGMGMLVNSHLGLKNANIKSPSRFADLHRGRDLGTGGSTTYHNVHWDAAVDIEAGAEIFLNYGDEWFVERESLMGQIPLSGDFAIADNSVDRLWEIIGSNKKGNKQRNNEMIVDALRLLRNITSSRPRLTNAIPSDVEGFERAVQEGTATLTVPDRIRSLEWLERNGRCLDNIRPDVSTIRQAGRGAFATRRIKKGDVITPMPLVQLRRRHMEVYDADNPKDRHSNIWKDGSQLLLNYCYGHPESSLLLFPYSPVVNYINHNVTGSNADLRWSGLPNHHKEWLKRTPDEIDSEDHSGLIMEMIATRDIQAGEEIFLNYGSEWDSAWNHFVDNWSPTDDDGRYTSTAELNQRLEWLKTADELETDPYQFSNSDEIFTACFVGSAKTLVEDSAEDLVRTFKWRGSDHLFDTADFAHPCTILERQYGSHDLDHAYDRQDSVNPVDLKYNVLLKKSYGRPEKVEGVPRKAIQFFDREYTSDNLLRSAFRHEIGLPDNMVPAAWRDLKQ